MKQTLPTNSNKLDRNLDKRHLKLETGTVKWYNSKKGYGIIKQDKGGEIFVHSADLAPTIDKALRAGDRVQFTIGQAKIPTESELRMAEFEAFEVDANIAPKAMAVETIGVTFTLLAKEDIRTYKLTPEFLVSTVGPYLEAISMLQCIINKLLNKDITTVKIRNISQNSPVSVNLEGATQAVEIVQDIIVPWRRKHIRKMSELEEHEKLLKIETIQTEIDEAQTRIRKEGIETQEIVSQISTERKQIEIERMRLENEKLRIEVEEARINLALKVLEKLAPELPNAQRISYVMQLFKPLGVLTESPLQMMEANPNATEL